MNARAENSAADARPVVGSSPSMVDGVGRSRSAAQSASASATGGAVGFPTSAAGLFLRQGGVDGSCAANGGQDGQMGGRTGSKGVTPGGLVVTRGVCFFFFFVKGLACLFDVLYE